MFTGLVEALGTVAAVLEEPVGRRLVVAEPLLASGLRPGESVAVNGACLTVVDTSHQTFAFQAGPETLAKTNLGELRPGDRVNLERALRVGDRLGGHFVQGHIDGVGTIASRERQGEWETVRVECPTSLAAQMVPKGSITIDGVSLTLVEVGEESFSVALIPHTLQHTTLGFKAVGSTVNLETDILGKYVCKSLESFRSSFGSMAPG